MKKRVAILLAALAVILVGGLATASLAMAAEDAATVEHRRLVAKGAQLWPIYCNQCHNARPGSEKSPYEWNQIMMHMRTLGNIPPDDANAILEYLKAVR